MDLGTLTVPEVWDLILDHLRSPSDLLNCNKVCKAWKKLLELKKTTFLMPKVFPILYKYLQSIEVNDEDDEDGNEEEKESTTTTILKMRLVSHGWKEAVNSYYQNHPALIDIGFKALTEEVFDCVDEPFPLLPYRFGVHGKWKSIAKLESFLERGFSLDSNPFITRYVSYSEYVYSEQQRLRVPSLQTAFKNMLQAFGSQIWTCELLFKTPTSKANLYKLVDCYLRLMPNLRSLQVLFYGTHGNGKREGNSEKEGLALLLENEPFPRLEHLTTLEMLNVPYPLSVCLCETNRHLQKLEFQNTDVEDESLLPDYIATVQLPSLEELTFPWCLQGVLKFSNVDWPIKVLNLRLEAAKLEDVFQAVSATFSNTLEHFVLKRYKMMKNNKELKKVRLELPKLRIFQLDISSELETLDFLQGCTALEEIQLAFYVPYKDKEDDKDSSCSLPMDKEDNAVILFKDCITSMNQSNIWQILDKLQYIKLNPNAVGKIRRFTRRQFEKNFNVKFEEILKIQ